MRRFVSWFGMVLVLLVLLVMVFGVCVEELVDVVFVLVVDVLWLMLLEEFVL